MHKIASVIEIVDSLERRMARDGLDLPAGMLRPDPQPFLDAITALENIYIREIIRSLEHAMRKASDAMASAAADVRARRLARRHVALIAQTVMRVRALIRSAPARGWHARDGSALIALEQQMADRNEWERMSHGEPAAAERSGGAVV